MMKKKFLVSALVAALVFGLCGCGEDGHANSSTHRGTEKDEPQGNVASQENDENKTEEDSAHGGSAPDNVDSGTVQETPSPANPGDGSGQEQGSLGQSGAGQSDGATGSEQNGLEQNGTGQSDSADAALTAEEAGLQVVLYSAVKADFIIENAYPRWGGAAMVEFDWTNGKTYGVSLENCGSPDNDFDGPFQCVFWELMEDGGHSLILGGGYEEGEIGYSVNGEQVTISVDLKTQDIGGMSFGAITRYRVKNYVGDVMGNVAAAEVARLGEGVDESALDNSDAVYTWLSLRYMYNADGGITIVSGSQIMFEDDIPAEINGRPVTEIGGHAFGSHGVYEGKVNSVIIPDSVKKIGENAFAGCEHLINVTFPAGLESIGDFAFSGTGLTGVTLSGNNLSIGRQTFAHCDSLVSLTLQDGVKSIGESAFWDCGNLQTVTISGSAETIGRTAFLDCRSLSSVTLEDGIREIGEKAFASSGVTDITIPGSVETYGEQVFRECHSLVSATFQSGVQSIGAAMFMQCENLSGVTIPESVTEIGRWAFSQCSSLTGVTLPPNLRVLEDGVLGSTGLTSIEIPSGVTSIGAGAFGSCTRLSGVTVPDTVTEIGNYAFEFCSSLKNISLPGGVKLGKGVFQYSPTAVTYR